ncbi:hypothetical protein EI77_04352 [Prosthecobacter fusiformis]|uniref:Uncharacterized protein n=1 Tax=Prosthecobacter fusiformis TaxID=48464 RepID=A0A4R7RJ51_9BACT|nr:hypothetical protein EI77_04352 [Prosthecobacter fusiformis]
MLCRAKRNGHPKKAITLDPEKGIYSPPFPLPHSSSSPGPIARHPGAIPRLKKGGAVKLPLLNAEPAPDTINDGGGGRTDP